MSVELNASSLNNGTYYNSQDVYNYIEKVSIVFVLCLITVLAIPGNAIVVFIVSRVQSMKTSTNFLLLNLCIADLLIAVISLPFVTVDLYITDTWLFGTFMCKLVSFSKSVATKASILILTALSLERYLTICRPNRVVITVMRVRILCAGLWIVAMGTALPLFINKTVVRWHSGIDYCTESWSIEASAAYTYVIFALFYLIPLLVMVALYLKIGQKLLESTRRTSSMRHPSSMGKATLSSKTRLTKICVLIILSFALSWAPAHILSLHVYSSGGELDNIEVIYPIVHCISYSNCALNPFLYCFMSQNFRNAIVTEWKRLSTKRRRRMYGGLPGMSLRGRDSLLRTMSMRIQGSFQSTKDQEETDSENKNKHQSMELETSLTVFESAL